MISVLAKPAFQKTSLVLGLNSSKRLGFLPNEDSSLLEPKVIETEKVLNGLIRAFR